MEQSSILVRQIHDMGKRESLMTQKLIPGVHQFLIELIQTPFVLDFIIKGKGVDKHSAALLQRLSLIHIWGRGRLSSSTLPLGVRGSLSSRIRKEGIIYLGR